MLYLNLVHFFQLPHNARRVSDIYIFFEKCEFQVGDTETQLWRSRGSGSLTIIWSREIRAYRILCESHMEAGPLVKYCDVPITKQTSAEVLFIVLRLFVSF